MRSTSGSFGFEQSETVVLAALSRGGLVESIHHGMAVLVDAEGKVLEAHGSYRKQILPRSAVKPLQAVAMRRAGLSLSGAELAISCGSHQGTEAHQDLVRGILASAGLAESDLQCPEAWPGNIEARIRATSKSRIAFNCSGKHAGFLATSVLNGWDTASYLSPTHPLQRRVIEVMEEFASERIGFTTVDGCGAPLHALSLAGLARAIARFTESETEIGDAMLENAWAVGDHLAQDSLIMNEGLIAKVGAEGVFVIGTAQGQAAAVKIADGSLRPAALVALKLLRNQDLVSVELYERLFESLTTRSLGGEQELGVLAPTF